LAHRGSDVRKEVNHKKRAVLEFCRHESGATAIEYGLNAAAIAVAIIAILNGIGRRLADMRRKVELQAERRYP
jgi:pilus assembly protein Flp/PilA